MNTYKSVVLRSRTITNDYDKKHNEEGKHASIACT